MKGNDYIRMTISQIEEAWQQQKSVIQEVIDVLCKVIQEKRSIYIFGCSHASIMAQEMFYRTGGLALINPIFYSGLMLDTRPITMTSETERLEGIGKMLLNQNKVKNGDILLIHSVSGRNTVPVEMAIEAGKMGVTVVAVTNLNYSKQVSSRHSSGKNLYQAADYVIDNYGVYGDACIKFEGMEEKTGPTSTVVGAAILNAVVVEVVEQLLREGMNPPVFMSANLDGGDTYNQKIFDEYRENIFYQ